MNKINSILKEVLKNSAPEKEEINYIEKSLNEFLNKFKERLKKLKINAELFVGGSFAKNTLIRKDKYDIDIFIRFDKKYKDDEISMLAENALKSFENVKRVHGSRDYFQVMREKVVFEIIPVIKIKNSKEARNITDLSYSHVKYINKKISSKKLLEDIKLAKIFCYANGCYGAESYISGFSGYGLELLVYYYKGFLKMIKAISKTKDKIIIDIEKHYKNKHNILIDINASKLNSPIILIDPTYKQRNALAALSKESFEKFQKACADFLRNPSAKYFEKQEKSIENLKEKAEKNKLDFSCIIIKTNMQSGDVAGSKLLKFFNFLSKEISRYFIVKKKAFIYNQEESSEGFFAVKSRKETIYNGPYIKDRKNLEMFKKAHRKIIVKSGRAYAKEKINFNLKSFLEDWKIKNKKIIEEMYISELRLD